jgi:beta-galactosidase
MILFGVSFYPELYPEEYWEKAFAEIKLSGLDVVRIAEFCWPTVEAKPGKYNFYFLDKCLDLCKKHKLKVILGTGISQAPQWFIKKYKEALPVAHDGTLHPEYGPRPNACRDNPDFQKFAKSFVAKLAERYAKHPALFMWQLDNEPFYPPLDLTENKDFCHCKHTEEEFIKWAKNKYKKISVLNERWGTSFWGNVFNDFDEISTPKVGFWNAGNPHIYLDWMRFKSENINKWLIALKKIVKKYDKAHKIGTNSFTTIPTRSGDHFVLSNEMEFFGWDIYPKGTENSSESLSQLADYWRSVCKTSGAEFIVSELQAGPNVRWGCPKMPSREEIIEWTKILVERGAKGIIYFNWRPPLFGSETGGFGILNPDGSPTERLEAIKESINKFKHFSSSKKAKTAIAYLKSSEIQAFQEEGWPRDVPRSWISGKVESGLLFGQDSVAGAYRLVYPDAADFISEDNILKGIGDYRTLLLPNPYLLSKEQFKAIVGFVQKGGTLVTEARLGSKDLNGFLYTHPLLEELISGEFLQNETLFDEIEFSGENFKGVATLFRDIVKSTSGVVARFKDGHPAIIIKEIGKGKVVYAAFNLFSTFVKGQNQKLIDFLKTFTK